MKNFIVLLVVLLLVVAGIGFYRGWFTTATSTTDHKTNVNLSVDREKIQDDMDSLKKRTSSALESKTPVSPPK